MMRWYANHKTCSPEQVECDPVGYPHRDANGMTQCDNTHYDTEDEAWDDIDRDTEAGISLAASDVEQAALVTRRAHARAAEAVVGRKKYKDGRAERERQRESEKEAADEQAKV